MFWLLFLLQAQPSSANDDFATVVAMQPARDRLAADNEIAEARRMPALPFVSDGAVSSSVCSGGENGLTGPTLSKEYLDQLAKRLSLTPQQRNRLESDCAIWSAGYSEGWTRSENLADSMNAGEGQQK